MDEGMDEGSADAKATCARTCTGVITIGTATSTATWPITRHVALSAVDPDIVTEKEEEDAPQDRDQLPNLKAASKAGETPTFDAPESSIYESICSSSAAEGPRVVWLLVLVAAATVVVLLPDAVKLVVVMLVAGALFPHALLLRVTFAQRGANDCPQSGTAEAAEAEGDTGSDRAQAEMHTTEGDAIVLVSGYVWSICVE